MKTTIHQGIATHPITQRLGQAATFAAIGLAGIFAPVAHGQTNASGCFAAPDGLVGWWRAEGNALDNTLVNNGNLLNSTPFVNGKVGQAFVVTNGGHVQIPSSPSLNVGLGAGLTIEGWICPFTVTIGRPIAEWPIPGGYGVHFFTWNNGAIYAAVVDINGNSNILESSPGVLTANQWQHVALSYDKASGVGRMLVNGVTVAAAPLGSFTPKTDTDLLIGFRPATSPFGPVSFEGLIDEISIYNRVLGAAEIQSIYAAGSAGKCAGGTTNPPVSVVGVPVIYNVSPSTATVGSQVSLSGTNFSPVFASNVVYFGATRAVVSAATPTSLIATVPLGATHAPVTVTVNGRTAFSPRAFLPTFVGTVTNITTASFTPGQNLTVADGPIKSFIADLDQDGKPDLVEANAYAHNISLFRNISVAGTLDGSSFAPRVDFPVLGGTDGPRCLAVADVDGDGKLDIMIGDQATSSAVVYRNIATPGTLTTNSFAAPVSFPAGSYPHELRVADLDGDGLPEILVANYSSDSISILKNTGSAGTLTANSFAPQYALVVGPAPTGVGIADLNGDDRPDLVTTAFNGTQLSLFRNVATPSVAVSNWFTLDASLSAAAGSLEITLTDLDGDTKSDLVVAAVQGHAVSVYRNQAGPGAFTTNSFGTRVDYGTPGWAHSISVADFNGDTKPDLAVVGELDSYLGVFQNQSSPGNINLAPRVDFGTGWNAWGVAAGDLDGDNRADIVFANSYDDTLTFYRNIMPSSLTNPPGSCVAVPSGAISWWRGEGDTLDAVGGNTGTATSAEILSPTGFVGTAFRFSGGAEKINLGDPANLRLTNAFTIETWILASNAPAGGHAQIFFRGDMRGCLDPYYLSLQPNQAIRLHISADDAVNPCGVDLESPAIALNQWTHVAGVFDGDADSMKIYLNGVLVVQTNTPVQPFADLDPSYAPGVAIGNHSQGFSDQGFSGLIDELAVYNRALGSNEIAAIFAAGTVGKCAGNNPPPIPLSIVSQPTNRVVSAGTIAQFTVTATGSAPLAYQWFFNSNTIPNATSSAYTINSAQPASAGNYFVIISNPYGAVTSSVATLTVLTFPPTITKQPTNLAVIVTTAASFSVQATGSVTLAYQWLFNGQPLAGKTSTTLAFTSVQFSNAGNYSVIVTNPYGAVTSSVATLTVNPIPPCASVHDGLVSWWKGENSALDNWGLNNPQMSIPRYTTGKVGLAFSGPFLNIADSPSLRITSGLTIEAWVNPVTSQGTQVILAKHEYPGFQPSGTQSAYLLGLTNNNALFFTLTPNGSVRTNTILVTTNTLPLNQWSHVAATYDGAVMRLYLNGTQVGLRNHGGGIFPGNTPLGIGGFAIGTSSPWQFTGLLDEISLYNRALSDTEIQTIINANLVGKCLAPPIITQSPQSQIVPLGEDVKFSVEVSGSRPQVYQWYFNGLNTQFTNQRIIGATNATLIIEKIRTNNIGAYFVTVTNSLGSNYSATAQLTTLPSPSCVDVLPGRISWWPGDGNLTDAMAANPVTSFSGTYATGKVANAFVFNGNTSRLLVSSSTSLNFTNQQNFSIEMWIKTTNRFSSFAGGPPIYPNIPLFEKRDSFSTGWRGYSLSLYNGQLAFSLGALGINTNGLFISSGPDLRDGFFHHIAMTLNRTASNGGVLYVDGTPVLVFDPRAFTNSLSTPSSLVIGAPTMTLSDSYFAGWIDEPAIYNRALTPVEIQSIRTAGAAGRCKSAPAIITQPVGGNVVSGSNFTMTVLATGTPNLRYQWRRNNQFLFGSTNASLILSNFNNSQIGTYSVIVSNGFGTVISSNAIVNLNRLPIANADAFNTSSNTATAFPVTKLLLNDTDADGDALTVTAISANSAQNGTVSLVAGQVTYSPPTNFVGNDTFTYVLSDNRGGTAIGTVMATVGTGGAAPLNIVYGPTVANGEFVVRFAGIPGLTYTIEATPAFQVPWTKVANVTAPTTDTGLGIGVFEFREPVAGETSRYYRTVYPSY